MTTHIDEARQTTVKAILAIVQSIAGSPAPQYDGIYYDSVNGSAGTGATNGLPSNPSNSVADTLTMLTARKLSKVYVVNCQFQLAANITPFDGYEFVGIGGVAVFDSNGFDPKESFYTNIALADNGMSPTNAHQQSAKDCILASQCTFNGRFDGCTIKGSQYGYNLANDRDQLYENCVFTNNANLGFFGAGGAILNGCSGEVLLRGMVTGTIVNIFGEDLAVTIDAGCTGGTINAYGNVKIIGKEAAILAGVTVNDYTNLPNDEIAVNLPSVDNAMEYIVLDLQVAGFHYTVDDLALDFADPVAETITAKLYKLVNGALTLVKTATPVATPGGPKLLTDLFGVDHIAGDQIKITVEANGVTGYAVTGSYTYRSA